MIHEQDEEEYFTPSLCRWIGEHYGGETMTHIKQTRDDFERWALSASVNINKDSFGEYDTESTKQQWKLWQEACYARDIRWHDIVAAREKSIRILVDGLQDVANPLAHFTRLAARNGDKLDGRMAISLMSDPETYKSIATSTLTSYEFLR